MNIRDREMTLTLKSRPLRCAYIVRNREELLDAVTLYSHIWGGAANAILPVPNEEELSIFKSTLELMNLDYIFIPREELPSGVDQILSKLPVLIRPISKTEVQRHIDGENNLLRLKGGSLSHIEEILSSIHPSKIENSRIRFLETNGSLEFETALHTGLLSHPYRDYLVQYLGASALYHPESDEYLLKTFLVATKLLNPLSLTLAATRAKSNFNFYSVEIDDPETLCLFLDDGKELGLVTSFWNRRYLFPKNKIFLPREKFLKNIETYTSQIIEFMPFVRAISITTPLSADEALNLHDCLKDIFSQAGREVSIKIYYQNFHFGWIPSTLSSGKTISCTRATTAESCIRFEPYTPIGHGSTDFAFGYDAEVKIISGRQFFSPKTVTGSRLLTNELWRLEYLEENRNNLGKHWLRQDLPVRAMDKGIAGIAIPGKECSFFIHSDNFIITQHLKEIGFEVKFNEHTRYAQGLTKRLGGIEEITSLIEDGGAEIIATLVADRADQEGLNKDKLIGSLIKKYGVEPEDARRMIQRKLQPLLASNLLRRGYLHICQNCNLKTWTPLGAIEEFIDCKGCAEKEQLPLYPLDFVYRPNELAAQLIREGGLAVLMTASTLKKILSLSSSFIQFGGDFLRTDKTKAAEIDLFWLTEQALIISECKSIFFNKDAKKEKIENEIKEKNERVRQSLENNLDMAKRLGAGAVVLGVFTNLSDTSNLSDTVAGMAELARQQGIGLHLALNGKIHLWGNPDGTEPRRVKLEDLLVDEESFLEEHSVGETPANYGGTIGSRGLFDKEVFQKWESELRV